MMILRCCYHQILGPGRHLPKFANGCYRHSDIWVRLDPHLTWQANKSYVERGDALGLYYIMVPSLLVRVLLSACARSGRTAKQGDELAAVHSAALVFPVYIRLAPSISGIHARFQWLGPFLPFAGIR
jgi:hypothetical protein